MERLRRAVEERRQHVQGLLGDAVRQPERRVGEARPRRLALVGPHRGERGARRRSVALQRLDQDDPGAYLHRERVLPLERRLHPLRGAELGQRLLEPALPEPHEGPREMEDGLRFELPRRRLRTSDPVEPPLGLVEATEPRQRGRGRRDRGREDAMGSPSVGVGDRHRLLAQPQPDVR